ncbi:MULTISPECIES: acyl-CoA carboxylase subunit epsilon [unclassified Microbacterium]|uniref:acyl-CoA carboxylase subunit epsilon n=1 Tax=unclassified Microbacterium TaxID=2609290 RepID=UPI0038666115
MTESDAVDVAPVRVDVLRGTPTPEELAAVVAVVTESYVQEASGALAPETSSSAWHASARGLRSPLRRDVPWGRFSG